MSVSGVKRDYFEIPLKKEDPALHRMLSEMKVQPGGEWKNQVTPEALRKAGIPLAFFKRFASATNPRNPDDMTFDALESRLLRKALTAIDGAETSGKTILRDPKALREKLTKMEQDPCWFRANSLKLAIFGKSSGAQNYYLNVKITASGSVKKEWDSAKFYPCQFIPELATQTSGLFFSKDKMPQAIQRVARSTVEITVAGPRASRGSGVAVHAPDYFLTAAHALSDRVVTRGSRKFAAVIVESNGEKVAAVAEVLLFRAEAPRKSPDLAILYVPNFREGVSDGRSYPHLDFLEASDLGGHYVLGFPHQEGEPKLLVTHGRKLLEDPIATAKGEKRSTNIVLPGNSGGPIVDGQGRLLGIVAANSPEERDRSLDRVALTLNISYQLQEQTYYVPVAPWSSQAVHLIEGHQKKTASTMSKRGKTSWPTLRQMEKQLQKNWEWKLKKEKADFEKDLRRLQ